MNAAPVHAPSTRRLGRRGHASTATALAILLFALVTFVLTGGGRVVGSDELAMLDLSRAMLHGHLWVPEGATLRGPDGRAYTKNAAGQAIVALPLVAGAEAAASAARLSPAKGELAVRFAASFLNALVTALMLALVYRGARSLGTGTRPALMATLLLGFATPTWVYAKTFMAEPLEALGLAAALLGASFAGTPWSRGEAGAPPESAWLRGARGEWLAAAGALIAISVKLGTLPLVAGALLPLLAAPRRTWIVPALGVAAALAGHAVYDVARFGTPFETGYGAQATPAAYSTPLLVGLYGLLLSSGKGLLWFAPAVALVPWGAARLLRDARAAAEGPDARAAAATFLPAWRSRWGLAHPRGRAAWGALAALGAALLLYGRFEHWAGDGSYGPRYLVPVLPLLAFPIAAALDPIRGRAPARRWVFAAVALALGVIVELGGVAIYFGAQMREAGDYPYTRALEDPRFMSDSHFNPRFSPVAGSWRMLARNLGEHLHGAWPRLDVGGAPADTRIGVSAADQRALLHGLDFWWCYLLYAGVGGSLPLLAAAGLLALASIAKLHLLRVAWRESGRSP